MDIDNFNNNLNDINSEIKKIKNHLIFMINKYKLLTDNDLTELIESIIDLSNDYIINNILDIIYLDFDKKFSNYIYNIFVIQILHLFDITVKNKIKIKLCRLISVIKRHVYNILIPPRSYKNSFIRKINFNVNYINHINEKINILQNTPQPIQRSDEWYVFRHNLLTASSIWKVFGSKCTQNQLIYEKCKQHTIYGQAPISSPLHWGQKYEPISTEFYKILYNTEIGDFGCIKHPKYPFIGASPDGINIDKNNKRYGRMLEIKNVVSREINGIPKMEYWIQMQLQMETCDLNECDFLETKFIEYNSEQEFMIDGSYTLSHDNKLKGRMILFTINGKYHYEYSPLYCTQEIYDKWEQEILDKHYNDDNSEWVQNIFWKLEKYSNILVLRNKLWFENAVLHIEKLWNTIINERITGYEHRGPNLKKRTKNTKNTDLIANKCYILVEKTPTTQET